MNLDQTKPCPRCAKKMIQFATGIVFPTYPSEHEWVWRCGCGYAEKGGLLWEPTEEEMWRKRWEKANTPEGEDDELKAIRQYVEATQKNLACWDSRLDKGFIADLEAAQAELKEDIGLFSKAFHEHLEMMAAAFLKETNIPASECELVIQHTPTGARYYYRKREETKP